VSPPQQSSAAGEPLLLRCPGSPAEALPAAGWVLLAPPGAALHTASLVRAQRALAAQPHCVGVLDLAPGELPSLALALALAPERAGALLASAAALRACGGLPHPDDPLGCARAALRLATSFELTASGTPLATSAGPSAVPDTLRGQFAREALRRLSLEDLYPMLREAGGPPAALASSDLATRLYASGLWAEAVGVAHHAQTLAEGLDPGTDLRWARRPGGVPQPRPTRVCAPPPDPLVSFIVPTHDRPLLLARALESIAAQGVADCEAIVVNDAGADPSGALESFRHTLGGGGRVTLVHHDRNRGLAAARNTGLRLARGRYVGFLDDDDRLLPHHLEALLPRLALGARAVHGDVRTVHETLPQPFAYQERSELVYQFEYDARSFCVGNLFPVHALLCERSLLAEAGGFDESLPALEDWDLWLRVFERAPPERVPRVTAELRKRPAADHMTGRNQSIWLELTAHIYEKTLGAERADPELRALRVRGLLQMCADLQLPFPRAAARWLRGARPADEIDPGDPLDYLQRVALPSAAARAAAGG
jgi:hypothetical protein